MKKNDRRSRVCLPCCSQQMADTPQRASQACCLMLFVRVCLTTTALSLRSRTSTISLTSLATTPTCLTARSKLPRARRTSSMMTHLPVQCTDSSRRCQSQMTQTCSVVFSLTLIPMSSRCTRRTAGLSQLTRGRLPMTRLLLETLQVCSQRTPTRYRLSLR